MYNISMSNGTQLDIKGYRDRIVPHQLYQQPGKQPQKLAILLPGFGYINDMPLLHYAREAAVEAGLDVLRIDYAYNHDPEWAQMPDAAQTEWLYADVDAVLKAARAHNAYTQIILIGKSLGTMAMAHLLEQSAQLPDSRWVWLTPVLTDPTLRRNIVRFHPRSLVMIGTADRYFDPAVLSELAQSGPVRTEIIENANHSLEIPGDIPGSIEALGRVVKAVQQFINNNELEKSISEAGT